MMTAWALIACGFTAVALVRVLARRSPPLAPLPAACEVVLLRPVDSPTDDELENLARPVPFVTQLVVGPQGQLRSNPAAQNRKLGHLKAALRPFERAVLVADADVAVDGELVAALLGAIDAGADVAWAAPRPCDRGLSRGLLVQSLHSFEVLDAMAVGAPTMCGKAFALSPRGAGALAALPDCIGEDLELARVAHARGLKIVRAGFARVTGATAAPARFTRWMQVLRAHRPGLFPTVPLLFACTPLLMLTADWRAAALLVTLRGLTAGVLERRPGLFVAWLPAEALLWWCWVRALLKGSTVSWRGRALRLRHRGLL